MLAVLRSTGLRVLGATSLVLFAALVHAAEPTLKPTEPRAVSTLNQGKKWETDAAVRQGMESIRDAMAAHQERIAKDQLSAQDYQKLAALIEKNVASILANRKVSKEAGNAFHVIVMLDLTQNVELMRAGLKVSLQRVGALGMLQSLRNYGDYFQHPGWH